MFLSRLAMEFYGVATSALDGTYHETDSLFFGGYETSSGSTWLRALVHRLNTSFSDNMRDNGQKRKIVNHTSVDSSESEKSSEDGQMLVTESEMKAWVKEVRQCSMLFLSAY